MRVFFNELDIDCEVCEPALVRPHWWSNKREERKMKAQVGVRVPNCDKSKRDYIYLCDDCYAKIGYREIEYLIDVVDKQDKIDRMNDL